MRNSGVGNAKAKGTTPQQIMYSLAAGKQTWDKQTFPEGAAVTAECALGQV